MRITHVVVTDAFAGVERYVSTVCPLLADRGHDVRVVGGPRDAMPVALGESVSWVPGVSLGSAMRALWAGGQQDVVHAHLTTAEVAGLLSRPRHRGAVVATRHIARRRGRTLAGRAAAPMLRRFLTRELAVSRFVADMIDSPAATVLVPGVPARPISSSRSSVVLVAQRLEREKNTELALRIWQLSGLADSGWVLRIAGDGAEGDRLRALVRQDGIQSVEWLGHVQDVQACIDDAGVFLATRPDEAFGLSVLEAMSSGCPVVAVAAAGHLETLGTSHPGLFPADRPDIGAQFLRELAEDTQLRRELGEAGYRRQRELFDLERHVDDLLGVYGAVISPAT